MRGAVPAVELAGRALGAVEGDQPDVLGAARREPPLLRAAAPHEQPLGVDPQAHVPEQPVDQAARHEDPAGPSDQEPLGREGEGRVGRVGHVGHVFTAIPPSGWSTPPVMPRARAEARNT